MPLEDLPELVGDGGVFQESRRQAQEVAFKVVTMLLALDALDITQPDIGQLFTLDGVRMVVETVDKWEQL